MRILKKTATVAEIVEDKPEYQIVLLNESANPAISFKPFTGELKPGDTVLLNITATYLNLGTGGYDYVVAKMENGSLDFESEKESHIMKLNYTPFQASFPFLEETQEYRNALKKFENSKSLNTNVFVFSIHSHIYPFVVGVKSAYPDKTIAVIIEDSSGLPVFLSRLLKSCLKESLISAVISCGQAFGADYEAMNLASALIFSSYALNAEITVVAPLFGLKGAGVKFGHSALKLAEALFYAEALNGTGFLMPRVSFAEKRERHYGVSHHTIEIIELKKTGFFIPLPAFKDNEEANRILINQLKPYEELLVAFKFSEEEADFLLENQEHLKSMGRTYADDPYFFLVPYAAGRKLEVILNEAKKKKT